MEPYSTHSFRFFVDTSSSFQSKSRRRSLHHWPPIQFATVCDSTRDTPPIAPSRATQWLDPGAESASSHKQDGNGRLTFCERIKVDGQLGNLSNIGIC